LQSFSVIVIQRVSSEAETRLEKRFATLAEIAVTAKLSSSSRERIAKAHRVLPSMIATLVFFWSMIVNRVGRLNNTPKIMQLWRKELVAGHYIARVAERCEKAEERKRLRTLSETILARARSPDRPLASLPRTGSLVVGTASTLSSGHIPTIEFMRRGS